ncbi:MAG: hypothetical protein KC656_00365 [Myxococcales bacterium]|nr:hypothetical protein [Myxococcales bacterium]MCB9669502.1 hypothetical protein [Alphaproteobacteria bacterium]
MAIVVLLVMSLVVYETLSSSIEFNEVLAMRDATTRSARSTLSKLRRELELAYLTPAKNRIETVQTVFVGYDEEPDKLYFSTLAHQRLYMDSRESDQSEITVWAESAPREVGEGYVLYHRESPRVDHLPGQGGRVYPLAYNVRSFSVKFMDPQDNTWRDSWDTRSTDTLYRLPRAMELGLVLMAPDPDDPDRMIDVPFLSRFTLQYGQRLMQNFLSLGQVAGGADSDGAPAQPTNNAPLPALGGGSAFQSFQGNGNAAQQNGRNTGARGTANRAQGTGAMRPGGTPSVPIVNGRLPGGRPAIPGLAR